jgi:hypothetical protein
LVLRNNLCTIILLKIMFATHDATNVPKMRRRTVKSIRSRDSMWDSGEVSLPSSALMRTTSGGDFVEPECAERRSQGDSAGDQEEDLLGGVGGASPMRMTNGETAVEMIASGSSQPT